MLAALAASWVGTICGAFRCQAVICIDLQPRDIGDRGGVPAGRVNLGRCNSQHHHVYDGANHSGSDGAGHSQSYKTKGCAMTFGPTS